MQTILTLDSKFWTRLTMSFPFVMTGGQIRRQNRKALGGMEEGVASRRGSAARYALVWGVEGWPCPNLSPTPATARPSRLPAPRSQLGKSSKSPAPGPRAARTSGPFCARLPTAGPQPAGARTIPGLVAGGGAARVAKVTRARGGGSGSARAGRVARAVAAP